MIDYISVGKKIKDARLNQNLTQSELADELGVSIGYISQVESGDKCFNLKRLEEVAEFLDKPIGHFLGGVGANERESLMNEIIEILSRFGDKEIEKFKKIIEIITE